MDDEVFELESLELTRIDSVFAPANPESWVMLTKSQDDGVEKATTIPTPDLSEPAFRPVTPAPMGMVDLRAIQRERAALIASGLSMGTAVERQAARARLVALDELLSEGSGRQSMAEQAAGQRRTGVGVDNGTTTWNGTSIRVNADGSRSKVTTTKAKADLATMLRTARLEKQMTQSALAKAADVSERSVKAHEAGDSVPSPLVAFRLAAALDMDHEQREAFAAALRELRARA